MPFFSFKKSVVLVGLASMIFVFSDASNVKAAATDNVFGFGWSDNIGWISLNCVSDGTCPVSNYGVNLNFGTGDLSGYAWSDNIGWISFESADVVGCPFGTCQPRYDSVSGEFFGWARALAFGDGWDGWISLNCGNEGTCATSDYKVSLNGNYFSGWAWGDDVAGWIEFDPAFCASKFCVVRAGSCNINETAVLKVSDTDNAHAEFVSEASYNNYICCPEPSPGVTLGISCSVSASWTSSDVFLKLQQPTNSHVGKDGFSAYPLDACISVSMGDIACSYGGASCPCDSFCLAKISGDDNAHIGDCNSGYSNTVCCKYTCVPSCVAGSCDDGCGGSFCDGNACPADANQCTDDICSGGACTHPNSAINTICNDGIACTSGDVCDGAGNCDGTPVVCNDYCSGLNYYTGGICNAVTGICDYNPLINCNDGNVCTNDLCDDITGCSNLNNANLCNDGNPCTYDDVCVGGVCGGTLEICGNNFCRVGCETATSCPADCKCGNGTVDFGEVCDKNGDVGCSAPTPACKTDCSGCIGCAIKSNLVFMGKPVICIVIETIKWILSIAGRLILLILILSGIYYVTSGDNPEKQEKAKKMISYAIIGLVVVLVSYGLLALIDRIFAQS